MRHWWIAPGLPADVDDTAKCIISLRRLSITAPADAMIATFEAETHFRTYSSERNPSFTANCNVLSALLEQPDPLRYTSQITKVTQFLCDCWWNSHEHVQDKWVRRSVVLPMTLAANRSKNLSCLYSSLLAIQAFADLFIQIEKGSLDPLCSDLLSRVHITMFQICVRTLLRPSRPRSIEETSYRVLILCEAKRFPLFDPLGPQIDTDLKDQIGFLHALADSNLTSDENKLWIEKVSFGSTLLTQTYKVAAMKAASCPSTKIKAQYCEETATSIATGRGYVKLLRQTPLFDGTPGWQLEASMSEAVLFQPLLRRCRLDIFPRKDVAPDRYFDLIPFTWISCNNRAKVFAST
jgi:hypothetical protein